MKISKFLLLKVDQFTLTGIISEYPILLAHLVNDVYYKMLPNENESYLVLVAGQILLVMISIVYCVYLLTIPDLSVKEK